jgi:hypothetical protein
MRRSAFVLAFVFSLLVGNGNVALADPPESPGPWITSPAILCVEGYHLVTNPAHPEWGWLPWCVRDGRQP